MQAVVIFIIADNCTFLSFIIMPRRTTLSPFHLDFQDFFMGLITIFISCFMAPTFYFTVDFLTFRIASTYTEDAVSHLRFV